MNIEAIRKPIKTAFEAVNNNRKISTVMGSAATGGTVLFIDTLVKGPDSVKIYGVIGGLLGILAGICVPEKKIQSKP